MRITRSFTSSILILLIGLALTSCSNPDRPGAETAFEDPPFWSNEVVWYQIFVERFRNGDPSNDPTKDDIVGAYPGSIPDSWQVTPWTHDWYAPDPYWDELDGLTDFFGNELTYFGQKAQLRRYGGDLQGVLDKMDYLDSLGVTAIYFNPLNDSPSLHKYDPRYWHHIDRNFGPTPKQDVQLMLSENPVDPKTWQWTGADQLFLQVIDEFHKRGIKVILDFSWNHTGIEFWAWKDILENQEKSAFADWYFIDEFDDPDTEENEFSYEGWVGVFSLPEIRETYRVDHSDGVFVFEADIYSKAAKQHMFDVTQRWLDPNGDGDPSDGVDGFRLDVAAEVGLEFWRDYRTFVRTINPEAYLLGEIWWEKFPDDLLDPEPVLRGDVFDAPMNYRWYRATRHFFNQSPDKIPVTEYVDSLQSFMSNLRPRSNYAMMNLTASHDVPRFGTSIYNKNLNKYKAKPDEDPGYKIDKPDASTYQTMRLILAQQFTYIGAPQIWNGDEMGMWGADDPSTRKPLIWPDIPFEDEIAHPNNLPRPVNNVTFDHTWFDTVRKFIQIRKDHPVLSNGDIAYLLMDDDQETLAYSRFDEETQHEVVAVFNASQESRTITITPKFDGSFFDVLNGTELTATENQITLQVPARTAAILIKE
ncbi:MAG: alpha-amylase family glycosyl hydrolase [Bacteroidota bacterium]